jgi:hypothetical protein
MFGNNENIDIKRVLYEGSATLHAGSVLYYNQDTVDNILNYDKGAAGDGEAQTTPGTTAEGYQNEGKFFRVEVASNSNRQFLAGFVTEAHEGVVGPKWIDIQVPNGAILLARAGDSITIGEKLYVSAATYVVTNVVEDGTFVGIAMETVDRSGTDGLILMKSIVGDGSDNTIVTNYVTADSPVALTVAQAGVVISNEGAAGAIEFDLPSAEYAKGLEYTFTVADGTAGNDMAIDPVDGQKILFGNGSDVLADGEALTLTPGDANDAGLSITIVSNGADWVVKAAQATAVTLFVIP